MLLREVEYARPSSVDEAVRLLASHEGARALAGGQTLVNVMKARAASPDVLVDLSRLDELRRSRSRATRSTWVRWPRTPRSWRRPRSTSPGRSRRGGRADRRCPGAQPGHDRRQHLLERPDQPPAAPVRRARRHDDDPGADGERSVTAEEFFLGVYLNGGRRGRAAAVRLRSGGGKGGQRVRLDHDRPRRHLHRERHREPPATRRGSRSAASTPSPSWSRRPPAGTRQAFARPSPEQG